MIDYKKIIEELKNKKILKLTSKDLKEYGLNDYYIKKATSEGLLNKIERGKYTIIKKEYSIFNLFVKSVKENDFENAYKYLYKLTNTNINNDYDNHNRIYFLLLKELLGNNYDFSFIDNFNEFSYKSTDMNNPYFSSFIKFRYSVMMKKYDSALKYIYNFKQEEKKRYTKNNISTILFYILTKNVVSKIHNKDREIKNEEFTKGTPVQKNSFKFNYIDFILYYLKNDNYTEVLDCLNKMKKNSDDNNLVVNLDNLVDTYLKLQNKNYILEEKNIEYEETDYNKIFEKSLLEKDYMTAYKNIGKLIYFDKQNKILIIYKNILEKIIEKNKENITLKEQNKINIDNKEKFNLGILKKLLSEENYDEIIHLLKYSDNDRLNNIVSKLINKLSLYTKPNFIYKDKEQKPIIENDYPLENFFEAISNKNYQEAYKLTFSCIETLKKENKDIEEMQIYQLILEKLINVINKIKAEAPYKTRLKEINDIIFNPQVRNILKLKDLLNEKDELEEKLDFDDETTLYNEIALQIIDVINEASKNSSITSQSFSNFENNNENLKEKLIETLKNGDYISAIKIYKKKDFYQQIKYDKDKNYLLLYRELLNILNSKLEKNELFENSVNSKLPQVINNNKTIDYLSIVKKLIKKQRYDELYKYYIENENVNINGDLKSELKKFILFIDKQIEAGYLEYLNENNIPKKLIKK